MERLVAEMWGGQFVVPNGSIGASTSTSLLLDLGPATGLVDLTYSSASANTYDGVGVYLTCPAASVTAPEGEFTRITRGGFAGSTATCILSPALSADPNLATGKVLLFFGLTPYDFLTAINDVVRTLFLPRYLPLTVVTDGDMEASGVGSWTDETGTPTQTKETSIVLTGTQSLKLVTTTVDHSVKSVSVPVTEGQQIPFSTPIKVTAGSLRAQLYDVTNSAEIWGTTIDEEDWTEARVQATVPANCQNIQVRYIAKTASTTAYVDHAGLLTESMVFPVPSQVATAHDVMGVYHLPRGFNSEATDAYRAFERRLEPWPMYDVLTDYAGVNSHRIQVRKPCWDPLFVMFRDNGTVFTGIAATTAEVAYAPEEIIVEGALAQIKERLRNKTKSRTQKDIYNAEMREHRRTYRGMLEAIDLGKPQVKYAPAQRVSVP